MTTEAQNPKPQPAPQTTAIAKKAAQAPTIQDYLETRRNLIASVAPKHLTPDRLIKVALVARSRDPKLLQCDPESLLKAIVTAAELGLEPSGLRGQGYLIPRKNKHTGKLEATFLPGYRGLVDLATRGGRVKFVEARLVRARDKFHVQLGTDPKIVHEMFLGDDPGELTHVYSVATMDDGSKHFDQPMTRSEVERVRDRNGSPDTGPWVSDFDEMAKKTGVRRHMKMLPISPEAQKAVEYEESMERGDPSPLDVSGAVGQEEPQTGAAEAKARIKATKKAGSGTVVEVQPIQPSPSVDDGPPPMSQADIDAIQASEREAQ